ncbi:MAG: hypothetical protein H8E44_09465 [Planctomycetes bacterium]|nr:hypothetical protein [Planctomycetota bacterium]MBL7038347.1 hypothetical protein [Pirellulaceae bacterium]
MSRHTRRTFSKRDAGSKSCRFASRLSRRQLIAGLTGVPFVGGLMLEVLKKRGWASFEEELLLAQQESSGQEKADAITRSGKNDSLARLEDLKGKVPKGKIGKVEVSRLILGGNLIGGWAHARDLVYVSPLVQAYHTREKIYETFRLAEASGVNTFLTNPILCPAITDYWKDEGGKIQFISDCGGRTLSEGIKKSIDQGACACYLHGSRSDGAVAREDFDLIEQSLELIRRNGLPAGIGAHRLHTVEACVERGYQPDFWMKTLHHTDYWSAKAETERNNIWCRKPEETVAFMKDLQQPWIAYKTLAAGAIRPEEGFKYAFENGADFLCVGMFDFQIVQDANIALGVLDGDLDRQRPWYA